MHDEGSVVEVTVHVCGSSASVTHSPARYRSTRRAAVSVASRPATAWPSIPVTIASTGRSSPERTNVRAVRSPTYSVEGWTSTEVVEAHAWRSTSVTVDCALIDWGRSGSTPSAPEKSICRWCSPLPSVDPVNISVVASVPTMPGLPRSMSPPVAAEYGARRHHGVHTPNVNVSHPGGA